MKTIGTLFRASGAVLLGTTVLLAGCDVTNPGPVSDEFLAVKASHAGLVNGAGRRLAEAVNGVSYTGALISREIFPGGQTGSLGHPVLVQGGWIEPGSYGGHFNDAVQSRFHRGVRNQDLDRVRGGAGPEYVGASLSLGWVRLPCDRRELV